MPEDKEFLTLDEAAKAVGLKRPSLYYYLDRLKIKRHKFAYNRHTYIASKDVERIRAAKESPWKLEKGGEDAA
jgi:hypothetical protein